MGKKCEEKYILSIFLSMLCHGLVNSTNDCELLLSDSAHIFETAKFEAGDCSISSECHLVLDGTAIVERLEVEIAQFSKEDENASVLYSARPLHLELRKAHHSG